MAVSAVVPIYNVALAYFERCAASVAAQTCPDLEVILVDDGSDEGFASAYREIAARYGFRYVRTEHKGASSARNTGMELACGEWLIFIDADDVCEPDLVATLLAAAVEHGADAACAAYDRELPEPYGTADDSVAASAEGAPVQVATGEELIACLLRGVEPWGTGERHLTMGLQCVWGKLYRRSCIGDVRFCEEISHGEDTLFVMDVLFPVPRVAVVARVLCHYLKRPGSVTNGFFTDEWVTLFDTAWAIAERGRSYGGKFEHLAASTYVVYVVGGLTRMCVHPLAGRKYGHVVKRELGRLREVVWEHASLELPLAVRVRCRFVEAPVPVFRAAMMAYWVLTRPLSAVRRAVRGR